ncbi:hypothetical protein F5Y15DRAFT_272903 [Xylariaceae sp. FL0016]|nr:hypothetical protein F5Y15DRAFT_272903 [Xylariaceae sp. FL0016]
MFLHAGASLHGHEYSQRPSANAPNAPQRRNPFLRSAFTTPRPRPSTYHPDSRSTLHTEVNSLQLQPPNSLATHTPRDPDAFEKITSRGCDLPVSKPEAMSEDEGSCVSDSDASRAPSSARRNRRRIPRKSTTFALAHPPPKLRTKQRILHTRPHLLLQVQLIIAGQRPRPIIDVYPSSAITRSIIAPFLNRFPRIARIKRELGIKDVMLVKSENYSAQGSETDSDGDEESIKTRDLVAILSPLRSEDKTEIVLPDGAVWVAAPRMNGNSCSYDFVTVDSSGKTTTARWVRKQVIAKSVPTTPTSPGPSPLQGPEYKFTFSLIDPNCRRHPIMATLTPSSLDILDSYTTVSQSASRYPPTNPAFSSPASPCSEKSRTERETQPVEEWQKNFISVSAIWVALRHGWAPNCRPTDMIARSATFSTSTTNITSQNRRRSFSADREPMPKLSTPELVTRKRCPTITRPSDQSPSGMLPRRATSTGAAFIQKRRALQQESDETVSSDIERLTKLNRRAFSGDWNIGAKKRIPENSLEKMMASKPQDAPTDDDSKLGRSTTLAPPPLPTGRRAVSAYYTVQPMTRELDGIDWDEGIGSPAVYGAPGATEQSDLDDQNGTRGRHQRWRSVTNWFRRLSGR